MTVAQTQTKFYGGHSKDARKAHETKVTYEDGSVYVVRVMGGVIELLIGNGVNDPDPMDASVGPALVEALRAWKAGA